MTETRVIEKIEKLLRLAMNNPNENEAQSAMLKAQELMIANGIEQSQIQIEETEKKEVLEGEVKSKDDNLTWWHKSLAQVIGKNFRCKVFSRNYKDVMVFLGLKQDVAMATKVYLYAMDLVDICSKLYIENHFKVKFKVQWKRNPSRSDTIGGKNDFITGFINGLSAKFDEQVNKNDWGLILVVDDAVMERYNNLSLTKGKVRSVTSSGMHDAFAKGYQTGKNFEIAGNKLKM